MSCLGATASFTAVNEAVAKAASSLRCELVAAHIRCTSPLDRRHPRGVYRGKPAQPMSSIDECVPAPSALPRSVREIMRAWVDLCWFTAVNKSLPHSPIRTVSAQPVTAESQSTGGGTERTGRTSRVRFAFSHRALMLFTAVNNADLWSVLRVDHPYSRGSDSCRREWISL